MRGSLITRFAVRSLRRNLRRTLLSVVGIGVGCAVAVFITAFMQGSGEMRVRSIAASGFGHIRIAPSNWEKSRENELRLRDWRAELATARSLRGVKVAAPHARATGLLAFGTRVVGVEMLGVDPVAEQRGNRLIRNVAAGVYLKPGDRGAAVIGSRIAERLDVELEDDLFLTVAGRGGGMQYAMFRIVGIVDTGSREIDGCLCHVMLEDVARLTGCEGAAEITVTLENPGDIDRMASRLRELMPEGDTVLTWREVLPGQGGDVASDRAFMDILAAIVIVVVILGVTSARMTAILERKREFAVLIALGMKGVQVVRLILLESVVAGLLGAVFGLLLAAPVVYHTATTGINFAAIMGGEMSMSGVLFDPVLYCAVGLWMIPHAVLVALVSTLVAAIYPAWLAVKTDPRAALSLRVA